MAMKRIWIDIVNPPQVLFLEPIIAELQKRQHKIVITAKDHSQTLGLLENKGIIHTVIGKHGGKTNLGKAKSLILRVGYLFALAKRSYFDLSICHGARELIVVSKLLNIPNVTIFDYEYSEHLIKSLGATLMITPDVIPLERLRSLGYPVKKIYQYRGIKENIYLRPPNYDPEFLRSLNISPEKIIAVLRPPASLSHYHNKRSEDILPLLLRYFDLPDVTLVILPRYQSQFDQLKKITTLMENKPFILKSPIDGPKLLFHSDLVVSGGGTMIREAAVLGTPAYSIFMGKPGAVDEYLATQNRLIWIKGPDEVANIKIAKKICFNPMEYDQSLVASLCDKILSIS